MLRMPYSDATYDFPQTMMTAFKRGALLKCARCGKGQLFASYLKPVETCSNCGKRWDTVRAELAPAWASMTLSAHILVLIYHFFFFDKPIANWLTITILSVILVGMTLITLPSFKGFFMALVWWNRIDKPS